MKYKLTEHILPTAILSIITIVVFAAACIILKRSSVDKNVNSTSLSETQKLTQQIKKLQPGLHNYLYEAYAEQVITHCIRFEKEAVAIFMQESSFQAHKVNNGVDFGLGQINAPTWEKFFDIKDRKELLNPLIGIRLSCIILKMLKAGFGDKEINWWSRYHSWNSEPRSVYEQNVKKYLKQLEVGNESK